MSDFNPANFITIASDSIETLRKCDVYRVLNCDYGMAVHVKDYILLHRPDIVDEVDDCWEEIKASC